MIKLAIFDFDGTFTDGTCIIDNDGNVIKKYNVKDGYGLKLLQEQGIQICVITGYRQTNSVEGLLNKFK